MVCTVSFQSSRLLWAFVKFVSLWQAWQFSVAIAFPSPSGNSTAAFAGPGRGGGRGCRWCIRRGSGVFGPKVGGKILRQYIDLVIGDTRAAVDHGVNRVFP